MNGYFVGKAPWPGQVSASFSRRKSIPSSCDPAQLAFFWEICMFGCFVVGIGESLVRRCQALTCSALSVQCRAELGKA